ncbi:MAG: translation initiation factor IF-2 [Spirosomataceae bacterium]
MGNPLGGPKVIGKIDLNARSGSKPTVDKKKENSEEVAQVTPPIEKVIPQEKEIVAPVSSPETQAVQAETPASKTEEKTTSVITTNVSEKTAEVPPKVDSSKDNLAEKVEPKITKKEEPIAKANEEPIQTVKEEKAVTPLVTEQKTPIEVVVSKDATTEKAPANSNTTDQPIASTTTPSVKSEQKSTTTLSDTPESVEKAAESLPSELIIAKGEKLQGLKVLGKIELPVERSKSTPESREDKRKKKRKRVLKKGEKVNEPAGSSTGGQSRPPQTPRGDGQTSNPTTSNTSGNNSNTSNSGQRPHAQNSNQTNSNSSSRPDYRRPAATGGNTGAPSSNASSNSNANAKKKTGNGRREAVKDSDVKDNIKQTMARMNTKGPDFGAKQRRDRRRSRAEMEEAQNLRDLENVPTLKVTEFISASDLASLMDVSVNEVISTCMSMGMFVSINQRLDAEAIQMIALEFDFEVEFISAEEELQSDNLETEDDPANLQHRAPIVTIMGHVDHGKTSLLDYIRRTKVASGEAGGITQHIGAYSVEMQEGNNKGKRITFLDTPGHEAFTAMRARGAKVTDVVIIVISADDSVMPQTREAINHAQNAGVPIVFAINKIDKPGANPQKIREDLAKENILVESWGGKYQEQEVSAKSGIGIDELLDKVLLEAELLELTANPNREAAGTVVEASLDKGRGYVSTILVQNGTIKVGDIILAGQYFGRVRAMVNDLGQRIKTAGPAIPVQILGLPGAPQAGDKFNIMESEREAREIANKREQIIREQSIRAKKHITLDEIGRRKAIGAFHELNVIIKGDFDGSVEALSDSLLKLATQEVQVRIIHKAVGQISESDVLLATAADAIIIGFQVRPSNNARKIAEQEQIEIRLYSIIYDAIDEIKLAMEGLLAPKQEEVTLGNIEIREVFKISKIGTVAGCYVLNGSVKRNNKIRIIREGIVVHEGEISQLKRFKDDVAEVRTGYECGLSIKNYNDIQIGDILESFEIREIKRTL